MSREARTARDKVLPLADLAARLRPMREAGRTVVFTNGCYDVLHAGHLHLLEAAARLGDLLVIGLNEDASVSRLKGPDRPVVPFDERALMLAGLEAVDFVVGFGEDTPARLIAELAPDVLVKGGDWTPDRIVGREAVEAKGGRVVTIPLLAGKSTSDLLERILAGARRDTPGDPPPAPPARGTER
jgi:D-beta-D-heptose 7-phosphate kinase/D-beta-D-heptose 1-phosphate adenosyltransferase